jgi:hypothetical protein
MIPHIPINIKYFIFHFIFINFFSRTFNGNLPGVLTGSFKYLDSEMAVAHQHIPRLRSFVHFLNLADSFSGLILL